MKIRKRLSKRTILILSIVPILIIGLAIAATFASGSTSSDISAKLSEIIGVVLVRNGQQDPFNPVNDGFLLKSIMQLQTKEQSKARLDLSTGSIIRLGQMTVFSLESQTPSSGGLLSRIQVQLGKVWIILKGGSLDVNTPSGLASVRGSYMSVWVQPGINRITVCCLEGQCRFQDTAGNVDMTSGQKIISSDTNIVPSLEKMDQSDFQDWLNNSPESAAIVSQISSLAATSTPSLTPTLTTTETETATPTPTLSLTLAAAQLTATAAQLSGAGTITPTLLTSLTASLSPTAGGLFAPTATQSFLPGTSPTPINGSTSPAPTSQLPPTATNPPPPTSTPKPAPTKTPLPQPTSTPKPAPTSTPVPYP